MPPPPVLGAVYRLARRDFHRNLLKGGIYFYPPTVKTPNGKLRLLYECFPLSFIIEQAGGLATDGRQRLLGVPIRSLHQRSPLCIGSKKMVEEVEQVPSMIRRDN